MNVTVERLVFTFPEDWTVSKFDDSKYYREQFSRMWQPIKAVDLIAVSVLRKAYLIEVKDYRIATDAGPSDLPKIVAQKVFDTFAAQIPCRLNANDLVEQDIASKVCQSRSLNVILHLELPTVPQGIFRPYDRANLQLKLRQLLKPIHSHPLVLNKGQMGNMLWTVQ